MEVERMSDRNQELSVKGETLHVDVHGEHLKLACNTYIKLSIAVSVTANTMSADIN